MGYSGFFLNKFMSVLYIISCDVASCLEYRGKSLAYYRGLEEAFFI